MKRHHLTRREALRLWGALLATSRVPVSVAALTSGGCAAASGEFLNILDFGARGDGKTDDAPALQRALEAGRAVYFPPVSGRYVFRSTVEVVLTGDTVIDFNGQTVESRDGSLKLSAPRREGPWRLRQPVRPNDREIALSKVDSIEPGDLFYLTNDYRPSPEWSDICKDCVEVAEVDVASRRIVLKEPCRFGYAPGDRGLDILIYRRTSLELRRPQIDYASGRGLDARQAIFCEGFNGVLLEGPVIQGRRPFEPSQDIRRVGICLYRVWNWRVSAGRYSAMSYPIGVYGGSRHGLETDASATFCRHGHADVGDWSASYRLDGAYSEACQGGVSTHPSFDVHVTNVDVRGETALSNMRCIGGSLSNAKINCISTPETPQYQSVPLYPAYQYLYDAADFRISNVTFDSPRYTNNPEILVRYGRALYVERLVCFALACGAPGDPLDELHLGAGNWFRATGSREPYMPAIRARHILRQ